jgi:non-canonical purine NTP pyrophosphatase (RdgB/HAM1 family)
MNKLIFATSNNGKFSWLERELAIAGLDHIKPVQQPMDLTEIQSIDIAEISLFKARQAFEKLQTPVLVHDGGFYINGLNGFPATYTKDMIETIGIETIARIVSVLDDKHCCFKNVATLIYGPNDYQQFHDTTDDIFTLTSQLWPEDHPKQWSALWRVLIPSKFGYTKPLAGFSEQDLTDYMDKRRDADNASALKECVAYLKQQSLLAA